MNLPLIKVLLEKNLIPVNSLLTGRVRARTLGGIGKVHKNVYFTGTVNPRGFVSRDETGNGYVIEYEDLEAIDGMDLARFARVYNIREDGSKTTPGKKRGRKPKTLVNNNNGGLQNGKDQRTNSNNQIKSTA